MCVLVGPRASIINTQRAFLLWAFLSSRQAIRLLDPRLYLAPLDWPFTRPMTFFHMVSPSELAYFATMEEP